jgi:3-ketoacyl-CoA synthase
MQNTVLTFALNACAAVSCCAAGMGCGNGVTAIGLLRDILQARPNSIALFVPAEITTYAFYPGTHKQYMVANCIFRMGGAAIMLSNKKQYARTAK